MNTENYLNNLKKDYESLSATRHLRINGWDELEKRIGLLDQPRKISWWKNFAITFAIFLLFLGSLITAFNVVAKSLPGDPFYRVKILSEKIIDKASGNSQLSIDNRAQEIVVLTNKENVDNGKLQQVVSEYAQAVQETKKQIQDTGQLNADFQKHLDEQHSVFDKISQGNPDIKNQIKDAQDVSDSTGDHQDGVDRQNGGDHQSKD